MATHVEANSLSDITHLAANPPKYPRNPTEAKRSSLTLYIARVPGTRDIILTTLKPQLKNVTASDVANSLYYLHLNTDEDARLIEEEQPVKSDNESISSFQKPLPRKPLPDSARSSFDANHPSAPPLVRLDSNSSLVAKRKPVAGAEIPSRNLDPNQGKPPISRRPLGPRPQYSEGSVGRKPIPGHEGQPFEDGQSMAFRTASPSRPSAYTDASFSQTHQPKEAERKKIPAFTITLIRRDASSDSQWNVGTISGTPVSEATDRPTIATQQSKRPYFEMSVHITTPGYGPFRNSYVASQMEGMKRASMPPKNSKGVESGTGKQAASYAFDREIRMEGSDFWARASFQHKRSKSDVVVKPGITRGRSFSGSEGVGASDSHPNAPISESTSQAKGYMFLSPWGGRCKFSTSSSGRSLRCSHTLPEPVSAKNDSTEDSPPPQASVGVSEIRFNLPSAAIFNSVAETFTKLERDHRFSLDHIRSKLTGHNKTASSSTSYNSSRRPNNANDDEGPPLPPRTYRNSFNTSSEDEVARQNHTRGNQNQASMQTEEDNHFDLSLGKEKAGGGNRGKRAKLGKLIIHDEGFKFLDLLVASNMAVWWSVWEPDF